MRVKGRPMAGANPMQESLVVLYIGMNSNTTIGSKIQCEMVGRVVRCAGRTPVLGNMVISLSTPPRDQPEGSQTEPPLIMLHNVTVDSESIWQAKGNPSLTAVRELVDAYV